MSNSKLGWKVRIWDSVIIWESDLSTGTSTVLTELEKACELRLPVIGVKQL
jgi:hypothetical protein